MLAVPFEKNPVGTLREQHSDLEGVIEQWSPKDFLVQGKLDFWVSLYVGQTSSVQPPHSQFLLCQLAPSQLEEDPEVGDSPL